MPTNCFWHQAELWTLEQAACGAHLEEIMKQVAQASHTQLADDINPKTVDKAEISDVVPLFQ
ncbi:hypothetical protein HispidOSU_016295, partial [Sigmodon hispidus]